MAGVFLSWSGSTSKHYATAWRRWLEEVFEDADVFMSDQDITAGADWRREVSARVRDAKVGIVFITAKNIKAPWILFESGALAIAKRRRLVVCMVSGSIAALPSPLVAFNAVGTDRQGTKKIFRVLREEIGEPSVRFSVAWPRLGELLEGRTGKGRR